MMDTTKQENLQKLARELSQKNSWIRKGTEKLMGKWEQISECGEALQSSAITITIAENNEKFYLSSGNSEIQYWNGYEWSDAEFSISKLKKIIAWLPQAMQEIVEKMKIESAERQKTMDWLKSCGIEIEENKE